jgi:hypothetical protein
MTTEFNWSWIKAPNETANESGSVLQDAGSVYSFRQPGSGQVSASDLNTFVSSVQQNFQAVRTNWRQYIRPILNSLPAGGNDSRWSTATGKALPEKINCFTYGVQGSTLFVFNDADGTKADGRYWVSDEYRPKTIAEVLEDLYVEITTISESSGIEETTDLDPLWAAIGENYRDSDMVGDSGSLDTRTSTLESYIQQINTDLYDPSNYSYSLGNAPPYSFALNIDKLLQLHNVSGWGSDPSTVNHDDLAINPPPYPYTDVAPALGQSLTQGRVGPYTSLENDILRLRYEIQAVKGSASWYSDPYNPVTSTTDGTLYKHINYIGTGTVSATNPHGSSLVDLGADVIFDAIRAYTGMTSNTDDSPKYISNYYVTDGDSLVESISNLDQALYTTLSTTVIRLDYDFDRSSLSESERETTPITVTHNMGRKPVVQGVDVSPEEIDYYGMYTSPNTYLNIVHNSDDEFEIWTNAAIIEVIAIF